jgi:hypothetical protein
MKKSQITFIIIIGIVLVLLFAILFYRLNFQSKDELRQDDLSNNEEIFAYVDDCLMQVVRQGVDEIGFNSETDLKNYVNTHILGCVQLYSLYDKLTVADTESEVTINNADRISLSKQDK